MLLGAYCLLLNAAMYISCARILIFSNNNCLSFYTFRMYQYLYLYATFKSESTQTPPRVPSEVSMFPLHQCFLLSIVQLTSHNFIQCRHLSCSNACCGMSIMHLCLSSHFTQQLFEQLLVFLSKEDIFLRILLLVIPCTSNITQTLYVHNI